MPKPRIHFLCRSCGSVHPRWMGKCPDCGTWDALERFVEPTESTTAAASSPAVGALESWVGGGLNPDDTGGTNSPATAASIAVPLPDVPAPEVARLAGGIAEFDRVLGGGLVRGSVTLVGGEPGIGKSTLLLQVAAELASRGSRILYVTSEESAFQTRLRAERLFTDRPDSASPSASARANEAAALDALRELFLLAETNLARIIEQARKLRPLVLVLDSIQMVHRGDLPAAAGSATQIRRCGADLVQAARQSGMAVVLVGHVTKDGQLAGPKLLEHLVDTVLSFEGDRHHAHRVVRALKNRFGTTLELGLFEMTSSGMREVIDPAALLDPHRQQRSGTVVCPVMHGSRCVLSEVQALTATGILGTAKRKTSGLDANRVAMLIAVLEKHAGLRLADQDVFAATAAGLKVTDPASDLAVALAIAGAHMRRAVPRGAAVVGEVGLGGEVRAVHHLGQRAREAARLGFSSLIAARGTLESEGIELLAVDSIAQALALLEPVAPEIEFRRQSTSLSDKPRATKKAAKA